MWFVKVWSDLIHTSQLCPTPTDSLEKWLRLLCHLKTVSAKSDSYIVGGAIRDLLLWHEPNDIDIATNVPMNLLEEAFETHDIGSNKEFWILVIKFEGEWFEVAQFRSESDCDGRYPWSVVFEDSIEKDLSRRDFTCNAMAMDSDCNIIDPHGWWSDINRWVLRFVGNAEERVAEDKLRVLRAMRFASRFWRAMDKDMKHELRDADLEWVSIERVIGEMKKCSSYGSTKLKWFCQMMWYFWFRHLLPHDCDFSMLSHVKSKQFVVHVCCMMSKAWPDTWRLEKMKLSTKEVKIIMFWLCNFRKFRDFPEMDLYDVAILERNDLSRVVHQINKSDPRYKETRLAIEKKMSILESTNLDWALENYNWNRIQENVSNIREKRHIGDIKERLHRYIVNHIKQVTKNRVLLFINKRYETVYLSTQKS